MISMIILLMINIIVLYICAISSFSLHITCFQEWTCELCDGIFWCERTYECHKKICCGMNAYQCDLCGKVYCSKTSLCGHKRKHHMDNVCYFVFLYRVWTIWISHIYDVHVNWEFCMIYMILYSTMERRIWESWRYTVVKWIIVWWCRWWLQHGRGWWFSRYTFAVNWSEICYEYMSYMSKCMLLFVYLNEVFIESFKT